MADKNAVFPNVLTDDSGAPLKLKMHDNSDGSFSVATYTIGSAGGGGGGASTIADGADVAEGSTTDAVVAAGAAGTVSAKLRRISSDIASILTLQSNGNQQVQGNIAAAATDAGNPVKVGGKYNATLPTYTDGQRGDMQLDASGRLIMNGPAPAGSNITTFNVNPMQLGASDGGNLRAVVVARTASDAGAGDTSIAVHPVVYNGSTYDHMRGSAAAGLFVNIRATPTVTTVSVATSSTSVLASNTSRKSVIFANTGTNTIYLNLAGGTAVTTNIPLAANEKFIWDEWVSSTAITAIAATSATNLSVTEMA